MRNTLYDEAFFEECRPGAERSAEKILSIVLTLLTAKSVVDVGCGQGAWLSVVRRLGIEDICGIDGSYINKKLLQIPRECFLEADLSRPLVVDRQFELALCLEVVEHLPSSHNDLFLDQLTSLSPVILFSGSLPFQEGTSHINEQWLEYWVEHFARRGYRAVDCIRPQVWNDPDVDWWYAQNTLLYVRESDLDRYPKIAGCVRDGAASPFSCVHPRFLLYKESLTVLNLPLRQVLSAAWRRLWRKVLLRTHTPKFVLPPSPCKTQTEDFHTSPR